jgi:hypothetical protein
MNVIFQSSKSVACSRNENRAQYRTQPEKQSHQHGTRPGIQTCSHRHQKHHTGIGFFISILLATSTESQFVDKVKRGGSLPFKHLVNEKVIQRLRPNKETCKEKAKQREGDVQREEKEKQREGDVQREGETKRR